MGIPPYHNDPTQHHTQGMQEAHSRMRQMQQALFNPVISETETKKMIEEQTKIEAEMEVVSETGTMGTVQKR